MMDKKLIVIFAPILGAGTWAVFTISRQLLQQVKAIIGTFYNIVRSHINVTKAISRIY